MHSPTYDSIGRSYRTTRRPDPRIQSAIAAALGPAQGIVNVGAGAGSYEPRDLAVVAVEPSEVMVHQRPGDGAPVVRAVAEHLPFRSNTFDAALAVLTIHHWTDWRRGLAELRRMARDRVVLFTWDPNGPGFWLVNRYFPEFLPLDAPRCPTLEMLESELGPLEIRRVPIPEDCRDGFLGAYWKRPWAYLDEGIRAGMSVFAGVQPDDPRLLRLADSYTMVPGTTSSLSSRDSTRWTSAIAW